MGKEYIQYLIAIISHMDSIADSLECIATKVNGALAWGHHLESKV